MRSFGTRYAFRTSLPHPLLIKVVVVVVVVLVATIYEVMRVLIFSFGQNAFFSFPVGVTRGTTASNPVSLTEPFHQV